MKTERIMERPFMGVVVRQRHKSKLINLNDMAIAGNKLRDADGKKRVDPKDWIRREHVQELIAEVESHYGEAKRSYRGRNGGIWVHMIVAMDFALKRRRRREEQQRERERMSQDMEDSDQEEDD